MLILWRNKCKLAGDKWQVAGGKWQVLNGEGQFTSAKLQTKCKLLTVNNSIFIRSKIARKFTYVALLVMAFTMQKANFAGTYDNEKHKTI